MSCAALTGLASLASCAVQPYFGRTAQLSDYIDWVLDQIGPAGMSISTFSVSEQFLRWLHRARSSGRILWCSLVCDMRAARKTSSLDSLMHSVCDEVILAQNHSKVVILDAPVVDVAIVTSQNQTRGDRFEAGIITTDYRTVSLLKDGLTILRNESKVLTWT
jgi:hypothetical protein|nr:MAG TPA_asm: hypothetical protein [Caudoviricetes sp.]